MRLDKYVWAIRLFKTRSIAAAACNKDKVKLNDMASKPSKTVAVGDIVSIKENPIWRSYKILAIPKSRVGAKLVQDNVKEITSETDLAQLDEYKLFNGQQGNHNWSNGSKGRPTKKDRRNLDRLKS